MSDPRIIPADEAKRMREASEVPAPWEESDGFIFGRDERGNVIPIPTGRDCEVLGNVALLITAAPDLAHTVETQYRVVMKQAAQIERVREVLAWAEQAENRAHADWIATADTRHRDEALAYTQTVTWIRYALGDNDG